MFVARMGICLWSKYGTKELIRLFRLGNAVGNVTGLGACFAGFLGSSRQLNPKNYATELVKRIKIRERQNKPQSQIDGE